MVEVEVLTRERHPIALGELVNLSARGAQVDLGVPLDRGTRVRLAFHIRGTRIPLGLEGEVLWRGTAPRGFAHGLAFLNLLPDEQRQLDRLLGSPD